MRCRSCPAPGDQHSPRGATRSLCILPLSICRALGEARVVPGGEEGGGGRTPRFGVSERGFRTGSRHKHRSAAESISLFCLLAGQRGEGLLLAPAPKSSQGARGSVLPAAFGLGRYIKHFTAPK